MAETAATVRRGHGALDYREWIGEDLKAVEGMAAFPGMVEVHEGETVVLAWIVCPLRAGRDTINAKVMADPRLQGLCGEGAGMPFDSRRMVHGGFEALVGG